MPVTYCPKCCFYADKLISVINHIAQVHSSDSQFNILCGINGCQKNYTSFLPYRQHLYRCHADTLLENGSRVGHHSTSTEDSASASMDCANQHSECPEEEPHVTYDRFVRDARRALCRFYFKTSENHKLPHSVASSIFSDFQSLLQNVVEAFAKQVSQALPCTEKTEDVERLLTCSFVTDIFRGVGTHHQRVQHAMKTFPYVAPEEHKFSDEKSTFQYVPLGPLLKCLCEVPQAAANMFGQQQQDGQESGSLLRSFMDGALYQRRFAELMRETDQYTLLLLMYTDEFEISNPLGAARGKYKLVCVYFSVLNLHIKYRSELQSIYLVLLARNIHVQKFGMKELLKPLIEDLIAIGESGISVSIGNIVHQVRAAMFCFCGDNLSLNRLGGFTCSFSKGRICRFCLASSDHLPRLTSEHDCVVRNSGAHQRHLSGILVNGTVSKRMYGVTGPSPLLLLPRFDVTLQLPPDIMHDILEGSFEHVLRQVLASLISDNIIQFDSLSRASTFLYGFHDKKNKPEPICKSFIESNSNLKGTASQKWCLLRLLPLILGDDIPPGNQDWEVLLLLREVVNLSFAPEIPVDFVAYLQVKVQELLCNFIERYPDASLKPKLHYLVHYPRFIMDLGPLSQYWSMRFESKHQSFKTMASKVKNFRNICKTLASRHQLMQCYHLESFSFDEDMSTSSAREVKPEDVHECARPHMASAVYSVRSGRVNKCFYRVGDVLVLEKKDIPLFGQIDEIYLSSGKLYFVMHALKCHGFDRHNFCYRVQPTGQQKFVSAGSEAVYYPLDLYGSAIVPKWEIF